MNDWMQQQGGQQAADFMQSMMGQMQGGQMSGQSRSQASAGAEMCGDFSRGNCQRGERCRYSHGDSGGAGQKGSWESGDWNKQGQKQDWQEQDWKGKSWEGEGDWGYKKDKKEKKEHKDKKEKKERKGPSAPDKLHGESWEAPRESVGLMLCKELAPTSGWNYPLWDDSRRCYAGYVRSPWSKPQCDAMFEQVRDGTEWVQPAGSKGLMPRKTAWMVKQGCCCTYRYGPFEVEAAEYPPWMMELLTQVMPICGLQQDFWPDSCNLNLYEDGGSAVGWHADDEALFQGKFRDIMIISLSLGVTRKFELRYNWPEAGEDNVQRVTLNSGDLMTMEGMCQKHMQHRVPKEGNVNSPRINLTWRWVVKHTPKCPVGRYRR